MVTVERDTISTEGAHHDFTGLSTDTKPTISYNGFNILNGSTFLEMDTKVVYFYDAAAGVWR